MRRPLWFLLALSLAALAALATTTTPAPNLTKALDAQQQLTVQRPEDPGVWNDYGNLLLLAHREDEAESAYRHAVELDPKKGSALFNLGLLEQQKGHKKEALKLFEQVVENDPRQAWAHYQIGVIHESQKREAKAIAAYSRAFALDPQLAFADVNPQVVDSKLVTQAMLTAYRQGAKPPEAPKAYDDPSRIAGLLVPPPAASPEKADTAAKSDAPKKPAATPTTPGAGVPVMARPGTVLREGNIDRGSPVGQALPPGQTRQPRAIPGPSRTPGRPGVGQTWTRPVPNVDEEEEEGGNIYVAPPPPPPPVPNTRLAPPVGVIYTPGLPSTGRLDIKLLPGRPAHHPDQIAALGVHSRSGR